jgi:hypothetical protein
VLLHTIIIISILHAPQGTHRLSILRNGCNVRNPVPSKFSQTFQDLVTRLCKPPVLILQSSCIPWFRFFGILDNLDVNVDDPFGKYILPNGLLSTVTPGQWYNSAYRHEVKDPAKDLMMPIIFACEEMHLRKGGKTASWPLLFTTSILKQKMRNLPIAGHTLSYINDLSLVQ